MNKDPDTGCAILALALVAGMVAESLGEWWGRREERNYAQAAGVGHWVCNEHGQATFVYQSPEAPQ